MEELFDGIRAGDLGAVKRALDAAPGAPSSRGPDGVSAVLTAHYRGHHDIVEALIRAGCDLDVFDAAARSRAGYRVGHRRLLPPRAGREEGDDRTGVNLGDASGSPPISSHVRDRSAL